MPPKFFITHSWHDIDFARRLCDDLHASGLDGFLDERSIRPGESLPSRIARGLEECDVYIPILSPAALKSTWCDWEIDIAITLNRDPNRNGCPHIMPVIASKCNVPSRLRPLLYVDFEGRYDDAFHDLLTKGFGVALAPPSPPPVTEPPARLIPPAPPIADAPASASDELDAMYLDAMDAFHRENWDAAAAGFRRIIKLDRNYEDAAVKLDETERQVTCMTLYARATEALNAKQWASAARQLESLLAVDGNYKDARAKLAEAKRWVALPDLYKRALKAIDAKEWRDAQGLLQQILSVDASYREAKALSDRVAAEVRKLVPRTMTGKDGKEMILIPAGEFIMGSDEADDEKPPHKVFLDSYYISRYPVTNAEYKKFVDAMKHNPPQHWTNGKIPTGKENHPVVYVSWDDAVAFAKWSGTRLPTEAEWEKAASWDDAKKAKRRYPWGDEFNASRCNTSESNIRDTTLVGKYSPQGDSAYGVGDMAGNVWEWCADWYDGNYYTKCAVGKSSPEKNPQGPDSGTYRVFRGGSWYINYVHARCAYRFDYNPVNRFDYIGCRVAEPFPT